MPDSLKTTLAFALVSVIIEPVIVILMGWGLAIGVMGEIIVLDTFLVIAVLIAGLTE